MQQLRIKVYENGRWYTTVMGSTHPVRIIKQYKNRYDRVKVEFINGTSKS